MKHFLLFSGLLAFTIACNSVHDNSNNSVIANFGSKIDEKNIIPIAQLVSEMKGKSEMNVKVEGKIISCCQKKGCWMNIDKEDGSQMKVTFKDYGFFVPKDCNGKTAVFQGRAYMDTVTVEMLRHYAEDGGKSADDIAKMFPVGYNNREYCTVS